MTTFSSAPTIPGMNKKNGARTDSDTRLHNLSIMMNPKPVYQKTASSARARNEPIRNSI
jgi:hypothetical protein